MSWWKSLWPLYLRFPSFTISASIMTWRKSLQRCLHFRSRRVAKWNEWCCPIGGNTAFGARPWRLPLASCLMVVTILMTLVCLNATTDSDGTITTVQLAELHFHEIECIHLLCPLVSHKTAATALSIELQYILVGRTTRNTVSLIDTSTIGRLTSKSCCYYAQLILVLSPPLLLSNCRTYSWRRRPSCT